MGFDVRVVFADVGFYLLPHLTDNTHQLKLLLVGKGIENIDHVVEYSFPGHTDQLLGLAPGMRAQPGAQAAHWDHNFHHELSNFLSLPLTGHLSCEVG